MQNKDAYTLNSQTAHVFPALLQSTHVQPSPRIIFSTHTFPHIPSLHCVATHEKTAHLMFSWCKYSSSDSSCRISATSCSRSMWTVSTGTTLAMAPSTDFIRFFVGALGNVRRFRMALWVRARRKDVGTHTRHETDITTSRQGTCNTLNMLISNLLLRTGMHGKSDRMGTCT